MDRFGVQVVEPGELPSRGMVLPKTGERHGDRIVIFIHEEPLVFDVSFDTFVSQERFSDLFSHVLFDFSNPNITKTRWVAVVL